ncbi:SpoIIE family protein phosphatase [Sphaerisporangium sp. B11E5]|uniref:SpoIIE family protein phosphatase n=1 Tax=Sphaerisporangium sp. B11E5 TaxID=3153563 RepID=UPI00325EF302
MGSYLVTQGPLSDALRHMSDGFLVVDTAWRITFANLEAERILDSAVDPAGRLLWDVFRDIGVPHLEAHCRRAAEGTPVELDVQWPTGQFWYRIRQAPFPGGVTIHLSDVTARRRRKAERATIEQVAARRVVTIQQLTEALGDALTVQDVVDAVADHVLRPFGATGLSLFYQENDRLQPVGAVGYSQEFIAEILNMPLKDDWPIAHAIRDRAPIFISSADEFIESHPSLAHVPAVGGKNAWAALPLIASGCAMGGCVIAFDRSHFFTAEERSLFTAISGLVAQALERARLYDAEHNRAQELQRGLLPGALPSPPAIRAAARYLPANKDMEVGGDWYDVMRLSGERVALVIGDVMGHGVCQAATMGRLSTAVHALADLELPPDELLTHLNDLVARFGDDSYATCLYMIYDPTTGDCVFSRAGHPPPAVVHPGGAVFFPEGDPDPPLGAATPPFDTFRMNLREGSLLVLYTDGLVESATLDIDTGMADLARTLTAALAEEPHDPAAQNAFPRAGRAAVEEEQDHLESLCDALTTTLLPVQRSTTDDTALLIARTHVLRADDIASWPLPEDAIAAGQAREHIRDQLASWGLDELSMTTELLASELVSNVVRHAKGPIGLRLLRGDVLTCEVSDGGLSTPRIRRSSETDEGGRGLQLVAALSSRWGTRYTATGKCIWTELPLPVDSRH